MNRFVTAFRNNYSLYFIEAWGLGMFMISASLFTILFQHPDLKLVSIISSDIIRRILTGIAMGVTAIGIISSPWGRRSGAHINPSVTLTMLLLKNIKSIDVVFYILFQTIGGTAGVLLIVLLLPDYMAHASVQYVVTVPGKAGVAGALAGECIISFIMMFVTLVTSNIKKIKHLTGYVTGFLIVNFVTFEAPYSGFSMNPARTIASAVPSGIWNAWPLYMLVPPLSMLGAAIFYNILFHEGNIHSLKHYFSPKS
jgi:aquaporin Z